MGDKLPIMPFWVSDFLGSSRVRAIPGLAQGIYALLLMHEWNLKGDLLPSSSTSLCRLLQITQRQWSTVAPHVLPFFEEKDGKLYNPRLEEILRHEQEYQKRRQDKSGRAAAARWK